MTEKEKPIRLRRRRIIQEGQRINIGTEVDGMTWRKFRAHCLLKNITAGELLDKLMEDYLKKEEKKEAKKN